MPFSNPIIGGQDTLIRRAIRSPDYVTGISGWTINRDGTAEFNDVTVRGTIDASVINGATITGSTIDASVITADGGNIVLDDDGLFIDTATGYAYINQFAISFNDDNGSYVDLTRVVGFGAVIAMNPDDQPGQFFSPAYIISGSDSPPGYQPYFAIQGPYHLLPSQLDNATIYLYGEDQIGGLPRIHLDARGGVVDLLSDTDLNVDGYTTTNMYHGKIFLNGAFAVPNNAIAGVPYTGADFCDPSGWHDPVTNNTRVTPTVAGWYRVTVMTCWAANATNARRTYVGKNGSTIGPAAIVGSPTATQWTQQLTTKVFMNGTTDYFEHLVFQQSGAALNMNGANNEATTFNSSMEWEYISAN